MNIKHIAKIFFLIFCLNVGLASAATVDISNGDSLNVSTLTLGDTVIFLVILEL